MLINVIGLGYIGLPTSLMLSANGQNVVGTDNNEKIVEMLNNDIVTFEEDGLKELFLRAKKNNFSASFELVEADMYIVTVPTPYNKDTKKIDPTFIIAAVRSIIEKAREGSIIVIESTVSPGTINNYIRPIIHGHDLHLVHALERILPGAMLSELVNNSRTIGADDLEIAQQVAQVYKSFCKSEIVLTDIETAEMSKVVENTFRDINIAFANELAKLCREGGLDVYEVIKIANKHPRVNILQPGPGVGGHCISVDPWFLVGDYPNHAKLIKEARLTNDDMPNYVIERLQTIMKTEMITNFDDVGIYGLTYKENVDDIRESPTLQLLSILDERKIQLKVYDPLVKTKVVANQVFSMSDFLENLKIVIILVSHNQIVDYDLSDYIVFDTKNSVKKARKIHLL